MPHLQNIPYHTYKIFPTTPAKYPYHTLFYFSAHIFHGSIYNAYPEYFNKEVGFVLQNNCHTSQYSKLMFIAVILHPQGINYYWITRRLGSSLAFRGQVLKSVDHQCFICSSPQYGKLCSLRWQFLFVMCHGIN